MQITNQLILQIAIINRITISAPQKQPNHRKWHRENGMGKFDKTQVVFYANHIKKLRYQDRRSEGLLRRTRDKEGSRCKKQDTRNKLHDFGS